MKTKMIIVICLLMVQYGSARELNRTENSKRTFTSAYNQQAFLFYNAYSLRADVTVNWAYQNPVLVVFYVVERSTDGVNFSPVEEVMGTDSYFYRFKQRNVSAGTYYYRVVSYQHDGGIEYSQVKMVRINGRRC